MAADWLPFACALVLVMAAPALDLLWIGPYESFYTANFPESRPRTPDLVLGARWAVDVAQAVPTSVLTLVGVALLLEEHGARVMTISLLVVEMLTFAAVLIVGSRKKLHAKRWRYTPLQGLQLALNGVGLALSLTW